MKNTSRHSAASAVPIAPILQLGCLAASPAAVRAAIDCGADWVRIPFRFRRPGIRELRHNNRLRDTIRYVHARARRLVLDLALMPSLPWREYRDAVGWAEDNGFDAIVLSDFALAIYCATRHPSLPLHFVAPDEVCARTATLLKHQLNVSRLLVPRSLSTSRLTDISTRTKVELEVMAFDSAIAPPVNNALPAWATGNRASNDAAYLAQHHVSATLLQLPLMASIGIRAIQVEPKNDMPDEVGTVARVWRTAIDHCLDDADGYAVDPSWYRDLGAHLAVR